MRRKTGIETVTVAAEATKAMAMALKEKAVGSLRARAAVPNPWAAAPMLKPRATGSVMPAAVKRLAPKQTIPERAEPIAAITSAPGLRRFADEEVEEELIPVSAVPRHFQDKNRETPPGAWMWKETER